MLALAMCLPCLEASGGVAVTMVEVDDQSQTLPPANAATASVDEIVWAVNPANDTVERFVNYLAQYAEQFLEAAGLRVRFDIPATLPATPLPGTVRHCLFLAVREALNNVVRHARADLVRLEIRTGMEMHIAVEDTGCGFAVEQRGAEGTQEGLQNMRQRMEEIGGQFLLTSRCGNGTRVEFIIALAE